MLTEETVESLEIKIREAMKLIADSKTSPSKSGIGKLFKQLVEIDPAANARLVQEYKPVCLAYNENIRKRLSEISKKMEEDEPLALDEKELLKSEEQRKKDDADRARKKAALIDAALNGVLRGGTAGGVDYGGDKKVKDKKVREPKAPKVPANPDGERDRTVYEFEGEIYGKGPLVLAIIKKHCEKHPKAGHEDLKTTFPDRLHRSYGVFQKLDKAQQISAVRKRFFLKDTDLVRAHGCVIAVCNQWGVGNISPFVEHAIKLGYNIRITTKG